MGQKWRQLLMNTGSFLSCYSRGSSLVEVLVATLVISVGLLGVAAMQVSALDGANNTQFRSRATDLAMSLADRMRANNSANSDYLTAAVSCAAPATICAMNPDDASNTAANCTPQLMAAYDLWEISCLNGAQDSLPGGDLTVTCSDIPCLASSTYQIGVSWQTKRTDAGFDTEEVIVNIMPGVP